MTEQLRLFLCGDVMTGRGIDQVLPRPSDPTLHELFVKDARNYVLLAEEVNGPIPRPVDFRYVWGAALDALEREAPHARVINLETSVTRSKDWQDKGINYRMSPANVPVLSAAGIDVCVLANNHVLDWGEAGLLETLDTLDAAGLRRCGAGRDAGEAASPAVLDLAGGRRILVFAFATRSSGVPPTWAAGAGRPGVALLPDLSARTLEGVGRRLRDHRRPGDLVVASIHWGGNWGYEVPAAHRSFAHGLVDDAGVDVVHGHSSHHPLGIEVHRGRPILYGCGDFVNDYEGIEGHEEYQPDLRLMYFLSLHPDTDRLARLCMVPLRTERFRLEPATHDQARWLSDLLSLEGRAFSTHVTFEEDEEDGEEGRLALRWGPDA